RDRVAAGSIHDNDALFRGGIDINVIHSDTGSADHFQPVGFLDHIFGDLCTTADYQSVILSDDIHELLWCESGFDINLHFGMALQNIDTLLGQGITNENLKFHTFALAYT